MLQVGVLNSYSIWNNKSKKKEEESTRRGVSWLTERRQTTSVKKNLPVFFRAPPVQVHQQRHDKDVSGCFTRRRMCKEREVGGVWSVCVCGGGVEVCVGVVKV